MEKPSKEEFERISEANRYSGVMKPYMGITGPFHVTPEDYIPIVQKHILFQSQGLTIQYILAQGLLMINTKVS